MKLSKLIITQLSRVQLVETALVAVLLCVVMGLVHENTSWFVAAAGIAGVGLLVPRLIYPVAVIWFSLGNILSLVASPLLLTLVFLLIITPIGTVGRWLGHDPLQLKKTTESTFRGRNHTFSAADLKNSF